MPDAQYLYRQACESLAEGHLDQARELLRELLALPAEISEGRFLPDLDSFLSQIALGRHPSTAWNLNYHDLGQFLLSRIDWELGETTAAIEGLQDLLFGSPSAEGYQLLGRWLIEIQRPDAAAAALGQALQQDPSYLPAYEDLVMLANTNGDSDLAFGLIQQAMVYELTPRLFQELLLACSREDYVPMRSLFLELCVRHLTPETKRLLVPLLERLYAEGDYDHAAFLGFHLVQAFPLERKALSLYVLAALKLRQYAPALQALLQAADTHFRQGEHWFKLGVAYSLWRMPAFARHAFARAQALSPPLAKDSAPWLADLPPAEEVEDLLGQILRQITVQPGYAIELRAHPTAALAAWSLPVSDELLEAIGKIGLPEQAERQDGARGEEEFGEQD